MSSAPTPPPSSPYQPRYPSAAIHHRDAGTVVPDAAMVSAWEARSKSRALSPDDAYAMAVGAQRIREPQVEPGYRLYWFGGSLLGSHDVPSRPEGYVVVGRHGSCDVVLDDERLVSLRHVLVRASALDDGFPVLSVLDLQTTAGFELSDASKQRSIAATGPVVFRIGTHTFVALPSFGTLSTRLPVPLVERGEIASHRVAPPLGHLAAEALASRALSRVTSLPHSVELSAFPSNVPLTPQARTGEGYEAVLEAHGSRAGVRLSRRDLEHGVLIGRADKCVDEGLRSVLGDTISRVHVLLVREEGACHLYDVASLVGTYADGRRVRCIPLDDAGTRVQLALRTGATLYWRAL